MFFRLLLIALLLFTASCSDGKKEQKTGSVLFKNPYAIQSEKTAREVLEQREKQLKSMSGSPLVEGLLKIGYKRYSDAKRTKDDDAQVIECIVYEMVMEKYTEIKSQAISKLRDEIANKTGISIDSARMSWTIQKLYTFLNFMMEIYVERGELPQQGTFSTEAIGNDAWGNEIRIYYPGEYKTMTGKADMHFMIISAGKDGVYDNLDDMRLPFTKLIKLPKTKQQLEEARQAAKKIAVDKLKKIRSHDNKKRKRKESLEELMNEDASGSTAEEQKRKPRERKSLDELM